MNLYMIDTNRHLYGPFTDCNEAARWAEAQLTNGSTWSIRPVRPVEEHTLPVEAVNQALTASKGGE